MINNAIKKIYEQSYEKKYYSIVCKTTQLQPLGCGCQSLFSALKKEHIIKLIYKTRNLAQAVISDFTDVFYNRIQHHSHLGSVNPRPSIRPCREVSKCLRMLAHSI